MRPNRVAMIFSCVFLAGCAYLSTNGSLPIASWSGKRPIDETVDCVKRALDDDFRSRRPLIPDIPHHVDTIEQGRVYDISPAVGTLPRARQIKRSRSNNRRAFHAGDGLQYASAGLIGKMPMTAA
jgi:hypothetical protein